MKKMISQIGVRRGSDHNTFCEDFAIEKEFENFYVGAVFDGCSGGKESHFASALYGKIFNEILFNYEHLQTEEGKLSGLALGDIADHLMCRFYRKLYNIGKELKLATNELQSTIILAVYDKQSKGLSITYFGDGVIVIDEEVIKLENTQYENPNAPSYLVNNTYAFGVKPDDWYLYFFERYEQQGVSYRIFRESVESFSIFTDGITSFKHRSGLKVDMSKLIDFFARNDWIVDNPEVFSRKLNLLQMGRGQKNGVPFERDDKLMNADDISMVRVLWIEKEQEDEHNSSANQSEAATSEHQA